MTPLSRDQSILSTASATEFNACLLKVLHHALQQPIAVRIALRVFIKTMPQAFDNLRNAMNEVHDAATR